MVSDSALVLPMWVTAMGVWTIAVFVLIGIIELLVANASIRTALDQEERKQPEPAPEYQGPDMGR